MSRFLSEVLKIPDKDKPKIVSFYRIGKPPHSSSLQPKIQPEVKLEEFDDVAFYDHRSFRSNFYKCVITDGIHTFSNVETYFQYRKASMYFKDKHCANMILGKLEYIMHV